LTKLDVIEKTSTRISRRPNGNYPLLFLSIVRIEELLQRNQG
jgi:hypothetical protein